MNVFSFLLWNERVEKKIFLLNLNILFLRTNLFIYFIAVRQQERKFFILTAIITGTRTFEIISYLNIS